MQRDVMTFDTPAPVARGRRLPEDREEIFVRVALETAAAAAAPPPGPSPTAPTAPRRSSTRRSSTSGGSTGCPAGACATSARTFDHAQDVLERNDGGVGFIAANAQSASEQIMRKLPL